MNDANNYIYCHTNRINGKMYIGRSSQSPERRWRNGDGYKSNNHFYSAIQKYGWDNFDHEILLDGLTVVESCEKEKYFIGLYNTRDPKYGYNVAEGGEHGGGHRWTEEERAMISENLRKRGVPIIYNGVVYTSVSRLAEALGVNYNTLRTWVLQKINPPKWFCEAEIIYLGKRLELKYITSEQRSQMIKESLVGVDRSGANNPMYHKHHTDETKKKISDSLRGKYIGDKSSVYGKKHPYEVRAKRFKRVRQYDLDMVLIAEYESMQSASAATGVSISGISACCSGKSKTCRGYIWKKV